GNDVNFAVTSSIYEQFYGDPKYRPSFRQQRMVQSGRLGQKTGRGWYEYRDGQRVGGDELGSPPPPVLRSAVVVGDGRRSAGLADGLTSAGARVLVHHQTVESAGDPNGSLSGSSADGADLIVDASFEGGEAKR